MISVTDYLNSIDAVCLHCIVPGEDVCESCPVRKTVENLTAVFNTNGTDSEWKKRDGERCRVLRPLTDKEADIADVGPMYKIRFTDGTETDAFEDELKI